MRGKPPGHYGSRREVVHIDAVAGSLLEVIEIAKHRCVTGNRDRTRVTEIATKFRDKLNDVPAREGLRDFVLGCNNPWSALLHHVHAWCAVRDS